MKIIIFELLLLIKYFLYIISILGILELAYRKNLVQASIQSSIDDILRAYRSYTRSPLFK